MLRNVLSSSVGARIKSSISLSVYDGALPQAALVPVEYYTHTADPPGQDIALQLQRDGNTQLQYYFCSLLQVIKRGTFPPAALLQFITNY